MSEMLKEFEKDIEDAKRLMKLASELNKKEAKEDKHNSNAICRSAYILAFTAWETFIYSRFRKPWDDSDVSNFIPKDFYSRKIDKALSQYATPKTNRIKELSEEFLGFDLTKEWKITNYDSKKCCDTLDAIAAVRGELAHNSISVFKQGLKAQPVGTKKLRTCINFLKELANCSDNLIEQRK